jgi:hypothetical protein
MSLGAHFALHAALAAQTKLAGITVICPPFSPGRYFRGLPTLNLTALQHMTGQATVDELVGFANALDLAPHASRITAPLRIFHGGRDRTVPVEDGMMLADATGGPVALTVYERDHHNCLEHTDEIIARTLSFVHDPVGVCAQHVRLERVDAPATLHVSDLDATKASEGTATRPRLARLPFLFPGVRPQERARSSN